jgi:hypothetical protein
LVSFFTHIIHFIFPRLFLSNEYLAQKSDAYHKNYIIMQIISLGVTTSMIF